MPLPASTDSRLWLDPQLSNQFLEGVRGGIPHAEEQLRLLVRIVRHAVPAARSFLDLGCGDGVLGRTLAAAFPSAHGLFLDCSETMLNAARARLGPDTSQYALGRTDFSTPAWMASAIPSAPFDAIVSGYAIHHLPDARKQRLYAEVFELLRPGGVFLNLEHVASASPWGEQLFDQHFVDSLAEYHRQAGTGQAPDTIARDYYRRPDKAANILAPVGDQCQWLRDIGFQHVDCFYKCFELALFGGTRG